MEQCPHCSRTFLEGRLKMHLKCCKGGKPIKPLKKDAVGGSPSPRINVAKDDTENINTLNRGSPKAKHPVYNSV